MSKIGKWDIRYLNMAAMVASWSKDPSTKVGAVIVDQKQRLVSTGFNGFPRGIKDKKKWLANRELKLDVILHAEENVMKFSEKDTTGMTMYVFPLPPCSKCAASMIQSGIARVVAPAVAPDSKWAKSVRLSKELFDEAGVELVLVHDPLGDDFAGIKYDPEAVMREVQEKWSKHWNLGPPLHVVEEKHLDGSVIVETTSRIGPDVVGEE